MRSISEVYQGCRVTKERDYQIAMLKKNKPMLAQENNLLIAWADSMERARGKAKSDMTMKNNVSKKANRN